MQSAGPLSTTLTDGLLGWNHGSFSASLRPRHMTETTSLEPSIALSAYAEPLASNRRVLVFGNALGALALQLLERGARSVHVCDPDALRVSEANARNRSTQISYSSLADSDLSVREGAFELALIDDLGAFDALSLVKTAKRGLAPRGVAVIACPNPEASAPLLRLRNPTATSLDYYALYDVVAAEFEHVRMLGQTPFVGYAIADFSASGEPEPALDTSFVPGGAEEPDFFIALASNHEVRLDEFSVIQLPTKRLLSSLSLPPSESGNAAKGRDAAELSRLNQWIKELESRASTADERADHAETELEELRAKLDGERSQRDNDRARVDGDRAKQEAERIRADADRAKQEAERAKADAERAGQAAAKAKADFDRELGALRAQLAERDRQLAEQANQASLAEQAADLTELEQKLVERGGEVRRLEQDLRTAERTGRELVRELERRNADQGKLANADLERTLAEREADLQAATWTIESLSLRLELAGKAAPTPETTPTHDEAR